MELKGFVHNQIFTVLFTPLIIHIYKHFADFPQQNGNTAGFFLSKSFLILPVNAGKLPPRNNRHLFVDMAGKLIEKPL